VHVTIVAQKRGPCGSEELVALTGIEWVSGQSRAAQFDLSRLFSVELISPEAQLDLCRVPRCDRRVTPAFTGVR
jgi:hypothetical protein